MNKTCYCAVATTLNMPNTGGSSGYVYTFADTADNLNYCCQLFYAYVANRLFHRTSAGGGWQAWKEISTDIPTFYKDYNDLASLVTALGGNGLVPLLRNSSALSDFNDFPQGFNFVSKPQGGISNAPFTDREFRGWALTLKGGNDGQYSLQYYGDTQVSDRHYVRTTTYDGTWAAWRKISTTQL